MTLLDRALQISLASFPDDGPPLPAVLIETGDKLASFMIVTDRSDKAMLQGRGVVKQHAATGDAYAIVVDTYVRVDGERRDALLVEHGSRDTDSARVVAYRYDRTGATATLVGEPLEVEHRPSLFAAIDPFMYRWSAGVTPDFYNDVDNLAVHAVNHVLDSEAAVARTVRFLRARARTFATALPAGAGQRAFVDDRGQQISAALRAQLATGLAPALGVDWMTERSAR